MQPSPEIIAFDKRYEALRLRAYAATIDEKARGIWTIGYGHTKGVRESDTCTPAQADIWFSQDIGDAADCVWGYVQKVPTTQRQFDAMTSLVMNIGAGHFATSSVLTNHKAGHYTTAAWAFSLWNKQSDEHGILRIVDGLTRRRTAEALIYSGGTP